jgi:hypothetical protein
MPGGIFGVIAEQGNADQLWVSVEQSTHNGRMHQTERAQLIFLPVAVSWAQFAPLTMENPTGETMATLMAMQLQQAVSPVSRVGNDVEDRKGFGDASQLSHGTAQGGNATGPWQAAHELGGFYHPHLQRSSHPQEIVPVLGKPVAVEHVARDPIQHSKGKETVGFVAFGIPAGLVKRTTDPSTPAVWFSPDRFHPCLVPATPG